MKAKLRALAYDKDGPSAGKLIRTFGRSKGNRLVLAAFRDSELTAGTASTRAFLRAAHTSFSDSQLIAADAKHAFQTCTHLSCPRDAREIPERRVETGST